jgi:hypothetical protein
MEEELDDGSWRDDPEPTLKTFKQAFEKKYPPSSTEFGFKAIHWNKFYERVGKYGGTSPASHLSPSLSPSPEAGNNSSQISLMNCVNNYGSMRIETHITPKSTVASDKDAELITRCMKVHQISS